ncbi:hypothetical protein CSHISOI_10606, partial [Colletotrichum shisoi]
WFTVLEPIATTNTNRGNGVSGILLRDCHWATRHPSASTPAKGQRAKGIPHATRRLDSKLHQTVSFCLKFVRLPCHGWSLPNVCCLRTAPRRSPSYQSSVFEVSHNEVVSSYLREYACLPVLASSLRHNLPSVSLSAASRVDHIFPSICLSLAGKSFSSSHYYVDQAPVQATHVVLFHRNVIIGRSLHILQGFRGVISTCWFMHPTKLVNNLGGCQ